MVYMTTNRYNDSIYEETFFEPYRIPTVRSEPLETVQVTIHYYVARILYYIDYLIRFIQSFSPYVEKYQPILDELPKMYHLIKAFQQIDREQGEKNVQSEKIEKKSEEAAPRLFI